MNNRTRVATEVVFQAVSHQCSVDGTSKYNRIIIFCHRFLLTLLRDAPLTEDAVLRLLLLGLSEDFPMNYADTIDIVERLVQRSAVLRTGSIF